MLRIAITGTPGSKHLEVGREFAARLDLPYVTAKQFAESWCEENNENFYMFRNHYSEAADSFVTGKIKELYSSYINQHIVMDSLQASTQESCVRVLITSSILDSPEYAKSYFEEKLREVKLMDRADLYSENTYNMSFPTIYLPTRVIIDTILELFRGGTFTGHYLHPYQVLPLSMNINSLRVPDSMDKDIEFEIIKYGNCYFMSNPAQYGAYIWYLKHLKRMRVIIKEQGLQFNQLNPMEAYEWLRGSLPKDVYARLELSNRLARYAARFDVKDHDQLFLDLSRNANPLRVLREGGF